MAAEVKPFELSKNRDAVKLEENVSPAPLVFEERFRPQETPAVVRV